MESFISFLQVFAGIVWGPAMLVLLVGSGLYFTIGLRFFSFTQMPAGFVGIWKGRVKTGEGEISSFNALMTALADRKSVV